MIDIDDKHAVDYFKELGTGIRTAAIIFTQVSIFVFTFSAVLLGIVAKEEFKNVLFTSFVFCLIVLVFLFWNICLKHTIHYYDNIIKEIILCSMKMNIEFSEPLYDPLKKLASLGIYFSYIVMTFFSCTLVLYVFFNMDKI